MGPWVVSAWKFGAVQEFMLALRLGNSELLFSIEHQTVLYLQSQVSIWVVQVKKLWPGIVGIEG